jgi:hypothetical protein
MARKKIQWKECFMQGAMSFAVGFLTGGGLALGGGIILGLSPRLSGQRTAFFLRQLPKFVATGGGGFGSILFVGGFLRCL